MSKGHREGSSTQLRPPSRPRHSNHDQQLCPAATTASRRRPPQPAMLPQHRPNSSIDTHSTDHHHDHNHQALGETPHPAERGADDATRLASRKPLPTRAASGRTPPPRWLTAPTRGAPHLHHGGHEHPVERPCTPSEKPPPPRAATRRGGQSRRHRRSSVEGSARSVLTRSRSDHPGHRSVTGAGEDAACSREPIKPPTEGRSAWGRGTARRRHRACARWPRDAQATAS
jgi:hypothetical protein